MIATCFVAPAPVQAAAKAVGEKAIIMMVPPGLHELLEGDERLWPNDYWRAAKRPKAAAVPVVPVEIAEAMVLDLHALEDDDE